MVSPAPATSSSARGSPNPRDACSPRRVAPAATLLAERLTSAAPIAPIDPPDWVHERSLRRRDLNALPEAARSFARARLREARRERLVELQGWWIASLIATEAPLPARMTLFWQNHFTSEQRKVRYAELMYRQQRTLFVAHALGRRLDALLGWPCCATRRC